MNQLPRKLKLSKIILGIDEVGRGPWAGPLVIGAVILGVARPEWENLTDSKKLTAKRRAELSPIVFEKALATGLGWVPASELDQYGLGNALKLAARRAVKAILAQQISFDEIIIDGTINFLADTPLNDRVTLLKKADLLVKEVSAASIIAKVARDNYMIEIATKYPEYGFEKHVGYGTQAHREALENYGPCAEHRRSFRPVREIASRFEVDTTTKSTSISQLDDSANSLKPINPTASGQAGERAIISYLENLNHQIVAQNFKTKTYEIDVVSTLADKIYFTEVKYRKNAQHGSSLAQITTKKHQQMTFAAECFMQSHPEFQNYQPILAAGAVTGENYTVEGWWELES